MGNNCCTGAELTRKGKARSESDFSVNDPDMDTFGGLAQITFCSKLGGCFQRTQMIEYQQTRRVRRNSFSQINRPMRDRNQSTHDLRGNIPPLPGSTRTVTRRNSNAPRP